MAAHPLVRPLEADDEAALSVIDSEYATTYGLTPVISRASVSFYARSGHSFVVSWEGAPIGFILAQAVWHGSHPVVTVSRIATRDDAPAAARPALIEALTKSAYDAAVYDILVLHPTLDQVTGAALADKSYRQRDLVIYQRTLGSRGDSATKEG